MARAFFVFELLPFVSMRQIDRHCLWSRARFQFEWSTRRLKKVRFYFLILLRNYCLRNSMVKLRACIFENIFLFFCVCHFCVWFPVCCREICRALAHPRERGGLAPPVEHVARQCGGSMKCSVKNTKYAIIVTGKSRLVINLKFETNRKHARHRLHFENPLPKNHLVPCASLPGCPLRHRNRL